MPLNKALLLPPTELLLVQNILDEAVAMHSNAIAIRDQVIDVLQLNLQLPKENVLDRFGEIVDELLAHTAIPTARLLLAITILRDADFSEEADLLKPAIEDRNLLIRATPGLEKRLRSISDLYPSSSDAELRTREAAWRALEHLTFDARFNA